MTGDGQGPRPDRVSVLRGIVALLFVGAFLYMLVTGSWLAAAIIFPFAAAQVYLAVAAARGDLGPRY